MNGEWLRCDVTEPPPANIVWRQYQAPPKP
jgi:hypothetical protein